jgi:hypothetical protein
VIVHDQESPVKTAPMTRPPVDPAVVAWVAQRLQWEAFLGHVRADLPADAAPLAA